MRGIAEIRRSNLANLLEEVYRGNQTRFADAMGFKKPSLVSRYLSLNPRTSKPIGAKLARRIETLHRKREFWMDQDHQQARMPFVAYNVNPVPRQPRTCPAISWVQAGHWAEVIDNFQPGDADDWYPCPVTCSSSTFVLKVRGASMEPKFHDGEIIFVDPNAEARNNSFIIVRLDDEAEATFKQLIIEGDHRYLKPLNPHWPDPIIEINGNATICGVVIFRGEAV